MDSNYSAELKNKDNKDKELELEQVKLRQMELELELKKTQQGTSSAAPKPEPKPPTAIIAFLVILPPIGIIMLWLSKEPWFMKIFGTLVALFILSIWLGWIRPGLPIWFVFMGQ